MKEQTLQREFKKLIKKTPDHLGDIFLEFKDYNKPSGVLEVTINGWYDKTVSFPFTYDDVKRMYKWFENILLSQDRKPQEFVLGKEINHGDNYILGLKPLIGTPGLYRENDWNDDLSIPMDECCIVYTYNESKDKIGRSGFFRTEDVIRRMYATLKNTKKLKLKSSVIESYFHSKDIHLEYKGYSTTISVNDFDLRFYGHVVAPDNTEVEGWSYAADNYPELKTRFESMVENIIEHMEWQSANNAWNNSDIDKTSIGYVFDILPEKFIERIEKGNYDKTLNDKVKGGLYEVPLYYVTKAWDVLLKGDLCGNEFRVEDDPEDDEETVDRTLEEAICQNDEMKRIWKQFLGIDIDSLEVDFTKFNKHLPPNANVDVMYDYFQDVPDGIEEWILDGINNPNGKVSFDYVSSLMEFTAYILLER